MKRHSIEEMSNDHLRWNVIADVFGREVLVATFLLREDAESFVVMKDAEDAR